MSYGPCRTCGAEVKRRYIVVYRAPEKPDYLCRDCSVLVLRATQAVLTAIDLGEATMVMR